jgi:hypothetical protein
MLQEPEVVVVERGLVGLLMLKAEAVEGAVGVL